MPEGSKQVEITLAPHVIRLLEEEAELLDSTPGDVVENMLIHWAHRQRVRKARINQVEMQRQMAAEEAASGSTKVGGCP